MRIMIRLAALTTLAIVLAATPAAAQSCNFKFCKDRAFVSTPSRSYVRDNHRRIIGDLYSPGHGRRVQIRDTSRRIVGYIEYDGTITNRHRQKVGSIELGD